MDIRKIKKLIELVENSDISELDITEGEESVRITRSSGVQVATVIEPPPTPATSLVSPSQPTSAAPPTATAPPTHAEGKVFKAPMVGTYYSSPSPNDPAFIEVGSTVQIGDVVCIIEAMKLFNQIDTDVAGTIKEILVENGQPVEYGQPLFVVE